MEIPFSPLPFLSLLPLDSKYLSKETGNLKVLLDYFVCIQELDL